MRGVRSKSAARIAARPDPALWLVAEAQTEFARAQIQGFFYADEDRTGSAGTHCLRDLLRSPGEQVIWQRHGAAERYDILHAELERRARLARTALIARRYSEMLAAEAAQAAQEAREGVPTPLDPEMPMGALQRLLGPLSEAEAGAARSAIRAANAAQERFHLADHRAVAHALQLAGIEGGSIARHLGLTRERVRIAIEMRRRELGLDTPAAEAELRGLRARVSAFDAERREMTAIIAAAIELPAGEVPPGAWRFLDAAVPARRKSGPESS